MSNQTPNLSESDMKLLLNALTNSSLGNGKKKGMSLEYKNALMRQLTSVKNSGEPISQKPMSEMNEQEKKDHREALRQKLHEKTSTMKTSRGSKVIKNKLYENSLSKLGLGGNVASEPNPPSSEPNPPSSDSNPPSSDSNPPSSEPNPPSSDSNPPSNETQEQDLDDFVNS
jgi:hypothetical protein